MQKRIAVIEFQCITFYALHFIPQFIQWRSYFVIYITQLLLIIIYIKDHFSFTSSHLSSLCLVAHKAFTDSLHLSQLAATIFASSHYHHPLLPFPFQLFVSRWFLVFLFFFLLVLKLLLCCSRCFGPVSVYVQSSSIYAASPLYSQVSCLLCLAALQY